MIAVEDPVETDWTRLDDIAPLFGWKGQLSWFVEKVLVHGLPGLTCTVPGTESLVDFEQYGVSVLHNAASKTWYSPR